MTSSRRAATPALAVQLSPRHRPADGGRRPGPGRAEAARPGTQADADRRPQPRHPRRADHLRPQARRLLRRVPARQGAPGDGQVRDRHLRHLRRRRHLRQCRSARSKPYVADKMGLAGRAGLDPGDPARPPRRLFRRPGRGRLLGRAPGHRNPPPAAHRSAGGRRVVRSGPEGLVGHAAQAQPDPDREPDRPGPPGPLGRGPGHGERRPLARARHQPLVGRARHRARTPPSTSTSPCAAWPG